MRNGVEVVTGRGMGGPAKDLGEENASMDMRRVMRRGGEESVTVRLLKGHTVAKPGRRCEGRVVSVQLKVEETDRGRVRVKIDLDRRVLSVEVAQEGREGRRAVIPNHEDVILKAKPDPGRWGEGLQGGSFPLSKIQAGERAAKSFAHSDSFGLEPPSIFKEKVVAQETVFEKAEDVFIRAAVVGEAAKSTSDTVQAFGDGYVGVQAAYI